MTTATTEAPPAGAANWQFTSGQWTRNGELIATMENNQPVFTELGEKYKHVVLKRLKQRQASEPAIATVTPPPGERFTQSSPTVTAPVDPYAVLEPEVREAVLWLRRKAGFTPEIEPRVRKPVKLDKFRGDKVPAFELDVLRYDPVGFCARYGLLRLAKVSRKVKKRDPDDPRMLKKFDEVTTVAVSRRKTHLTERHDSMHLMDEGNDNE